MPIFQQSLFPIAASAVFAATSVFSATLSDDIIPETGPQMFLDPQFFVTPDAGSAKTLETANLSFLTAISELETGLRLRGDYASILALAPELIKYAPQNEPIKKMYALALAASGSLSQAEEMIAQTDTAAPPEALSLLTQAMLSLRKGDRMRALELAQDASASSPEHAYAFNLTGVIQAALGASEDATASFKAATRLAPDSEIFWRNLGVMHFQRAEIYEASAALEKALALAPDDCLALTAFAQVFAAALQTARAEEVVRTCLETGSGSKVLAARYLLDLQIADNRFMAAQETLAAHASAFPDPALLRAEIDLHLGAPAETLVALEQAREGQPRAMRRVLALAMLGQSDDALDALREIDATQEGTSAGTALITIALSVAADRPVDDALFAAASNDHALAPVLQWYRALDAVAGQAPADALELAKDADGLLPGVRFTGVPESDWHALRDKDARAHVALGMLWLLRGYAAPATAAFDAAAARETIHQARYFASLADVQRGETQAAAARLAPTVAALPDYFSAQVLSGELNIQTGQMEDALGHYRNAAAAIPDSGVLMRVGLLADMLDQPDIAEPALRQYIDLNPASFIGYNQLAWLFIQREKRLDEALDLARKADALRPGNASVTDNIGWTLFLQGDGASALPLLEQANTLSGQQNPDILLHLATVQADLGDTGKSVETLARLFDAAPADHPAVIKGRDLSTRID